jgi:hypothetical protein
VAGGTGSQRIGSPEVAFAGEYVPTEIWTRSASGFCELPLRVDDLVDRRDLTSRSRRRRKKKSTPFVVDP